MIKFLMKKYRLAKLGRRFYDDIDIHKAYAEADKGRVVTVRAVYWLVDGSKKQCVWKCRGGWFKAFGDDYYTTSIEKAEDFVLRYALPKRDDIQFDDNTASPYSAIVNYDIWIDE